MDFIKAVKEAKKGQTLCIETWHKSYTMVYGLNKLFILYNDEESCHLITVDDMLANNWVIIKKTLSDKIKIATVFKGQTLAQCDVNVIRVDDTKRFIEDIKEEVLTCATLESQIEKLDELVGERFK